MAGLFAESGGPKPLAARMRPQTLEHYAGQEHLLAPGMPTRQAIEEGKLGSVILWAPPGCGKTTLAHIIAHHIDAHVEVLSAVSAGVGDIRKVAEQCRMRTRPTLVLLDEIHRFSKSQQDSLLPYLEDGTFQMVGATTENPHFVLNNALLSRARVLILKPLDKDATKALVSRALTEDAELAPRGLTLSDEAMEHLAESSDGDARMALTALETACAMQESNSEIGLEVVEEVLQRPAVRYDRQGDAHYDTISAFIKSVRASHTDAAMHYLARMIVAGEDPRFIARRLIILASEDIGNAEPQGLVLATAAAEAVERIGMPEARITLAQITTFLCEAPKSNRAYMAIKKAQKDAETKPHAPVPLHLRNAPMKAIKKLGHGEGYEYPHDHPGGFTGQDCLPEDADLNVPYYEPTDRGYEKRISERRSAREDLKRSTK